MYTVFFAYQSDVPSKFGKKFILDALELAKQIHKKKGREIQIKEGFRGVPGTPVLINEMLKGSKEADMVLVDLTLTSAGTLDPNKKSPNPNVLVETGFAWATKDNYRTLAIMNTAYGDPKDLPVDFEAFRWPIRYALNESNEKDLDAERTKLGEVLYEAIKHAISSQTDYQRELLSPILIVGDWEPPSRESFYMTPSGKITITLLRTGVLKPGSSHRLIGPAQSGRTRLAYEFLRKHDEFEFDELLESVLYYDCRASQLSGIEKQVLAIKTLNQDRILILDNCDEQIHERFSHQLKNSNVRLLTIGDLRSDRTYPSGTIVLDEEVSDVLKKVQGAVTEQIQEKFTTENATAVLALVKDDFAAARIYASASISRQSAIETQYNKKWEQLLGKLLIDRGALQFLETLSIFRHIALTGRRGPEGQFVMALAGITDSQDGASLINVLIERGYVRKQGDFISVEAFVQDLAIGWWSHGPGDFNEFLHEVAQLRISRPLVDQVLDLGGAIDVNSIISDNKWGKVEFSYEFITTDYGAGLLLSLVDLAPGFVATSLSVAFHQKSTEDLLKLTYGRRNLVWALEKLAFRTENFDLATRLLFRLGAAENEDIGNNATYQFSQLFQPFLSGTQAGLAQRLDTLMSLAIEVSADPTPAKKDLILRAFKKGLQTSQFSRTGGAERQGGVILKDHEPTAPTTEAYRKSIIEFLVSDAQFAGGQGEALLISKFITLYLEPEGVFLLGVLKQFIKEKGSISIELKQSITNLLAKENLPADKANDLRKLLEEFKPTILKDQLHDIVILPPYETIRRNDQFVDLAAERASDFAKHLLQEKNEEWTDHLDELQKGEQRQTYTFGKTLAELLDNPDALALDAIKSLSNINPDDQNIAFIVGIAAGRNDPEFTKQLIQKILANKNMSFHAFRLASMLEIDENTLGDLLAVSKSNGPWIQAFRTLKYDRLSTGDLVSFVKELISFGPDGGWVAVEILDQIADHDPRKVDDLGAIISELISLPGMLTVPDRDGTSYYKFELLMARLLEKGIDAKVAADLARELLVTLDDITSDYRIAAIADRLLDTHWDAVWPILGAAAIDQFHPAWFGIQNILKNYPNFDDKPIMEWLADKDARAATFVAHFAPFEHRNADGSVGWSPLMLALIDKYGDNQVFLQELSARIHSYSVTGSALELFTDRLNLVKSLEKHSLEAVSQFSKDQQIYFSIRIEQEQRFNENFDVGELW